MKLTILNENVSDLVIKLIKKRMKYKNDVLFELFENPFSIKYINSFTKTLSSPIGKGIKKRQSRDLIIK